MTTPPLNFGELLQRYRLNAELTLNKAAEQAKISVLRLQSLETANFAAIDLHPHYCLPILERLCVVYGRTPDETSRLLEIFQENLETYEAETGVQLNRELAHCLEENAPAPVARPSAILISSLIILLVLLVLGGCLYRKFQQTTLPESRDYDLPALLPEPTLPLDTLPLP
ncbi:MAG: helix-turn-helix domain-containing protein [Oligosphaeraceae bacterium]